MFTDVRYQGVGIAGGILFSPFSDKTVSPFFGAIYQRTIGTQFSYDLSGGTSTNFSTFRTKDANYLIPVTGIRLHVFSPPPGATITGSFVFRVGYKIHTSIAPQVTQVSGPAYTEKLTQINDHIQNGVVLSVGVLFNFIRQDRIQEHKF